MIHHFLIFSAMPFGDTSETLATRDPELEQEEEETPIYEKHDTLLHGKQKEKRYL